MVLLVGWALATAGQAQEIATCRAPSGKAYYHFAGLMNKANAGWTEDKITDGVMTLIRTDDKLDLLFVDARKKPISSLQDGAKIVFLRSGATSITILVHYQDGPTTEIYSFFKERDGGFRFTQMQSKTGDMANAPKSSLMVGTCDPIRFDLLN